MYKKLYLPDSLTLPLLLLVFFSVALTAGLAQAEPLAPSIKAKVDVYLKKLVVWAADPLIVEAVKDSNKRGGIANMENAKWDELGDNDPLLMWLNLSDEGKLITAWEEDRVIDKLNLRDAQGNLVASSYISGKPRLYNNASRAPFQNGLKGVWAASEIQPDFTTRKKSVQIAVPVLLEGKAIGVLHSAVSAE